MTRKALIAKILDLRTLPLPAEPRVVDLKYDTYIDSIGDEALQIYAIFEDDTTDEQLTWPKVEPIEEAIHQALLKEDVRLWPYVEYRTRSEFADEFPDL